MLSRMDDAVTDGALADSTVKARRPGLGSQAVVLSWGTVLASAAAWGLGGAVLLPPALEENPGAWLDLGMIIIGMMVTALHLIALGVFLAARGLASRLARRPWSVRWALAPAALVTAVVLVWLGVSGTSGDELRLYLIPSLLVMALVPAVVALAARLRMPGWLAIALGAVLVLMVAMTLLPLLTSLLV